jgi:O-antigen/teichoic acid export membrane protein
VTSPGERDPIDEGADEQVVSGTPPEVSSIDEDALTDEAERQRLRDDDIRDLAGGAFVVLVGKMARASRGAFIWVVTLLCGLEVQGLYSLAWAVCSTLNKVARFGLPRGTVYFVNQARALEVDVEARQEESLAAGGLLALCASGLVVAVVWMSADWIEAFFDKGPIAAPIRVMVFTAPFVALAWIFTSATRALRIMRYEVYVRSVCGPALLFIGGTIVGLSGLGLRGVSWVQLTMAMGNFLLALFLFNRHFSIRGVLAAVGRRLPLASVARFSGPVMLTDLLYAVLTQLDVFMLSFFVSDIRLVGIFVISRRMASIVLKAPQAFDAIFSSIASELSAQQRDEDLGERVVVISRWVLTINLPIFASLLLVGEPLLQMMGQKEFAMASDLQLGLHILFILCIGMLVQSVFAVAEPLLAMTGRPGLNLFNNILWLVTNFCLNLWLIPRYGLIGAAFGAASTTMFINVLRVTEIYVLRRILPFRASQLKPLLAALLAILPAWWLRQEQVELWARILVPAASYVAVYFTALLLLRLEEEDRMLLDRLLRRWRT